MDYQTLAVFIGASTVLLTPVYTGLWKLIGASQKNKDDIVRLNEKVDKLLGCKYCKKGTDEI